MILLKGYKWKDILWSVMIFRLSRATGGLVELELVDLYAGNIAEVCAVHMQISFGNITLDKLWLVRHEL